MIYLDNAATGGFKPSSVFSSAENVSRHLLANPGRSGHRLSVVGAQIVYDTRKIIADKFDASPERVIFTANCTESLNLAILGSVKKGGHVITTVHEHNSVLRPLYHLKQRGDISLSILSCPLCKLPIEIEKSINENTYMVAVTGASNVTGEVAPVNEIGKICADNNLLFLCDGAQAGGHLPLSVKKDNLSFLALAGHKGLYSTMGVGVLILSENANLSPILFGGTGTDTFNLSQPDFYPERLECGTLNLPAIASLFEGVRYATDNVTLFSNTLKARTETVINTMSRYNGVRCFSFPNPCGIVSFEINSKPSTEVADLLSTRYDIAVRGGFHCAPLIHKHLQTDTDGLVRVSISPQNSTREINAFLSAIKDITKSF